MPIFQDPDIDPALTIEAQNVVKEASENMMSWLNTSFENIEKSIREELKKVEAKIDEEKKRFEKEDAIRDKELNVILHSLSTAAQNLSPLDADNKAVIDSISRMTQEVKTELEARSKRWKGLGSNAVKLANTAVKTAMGGIL